MSDERVTEHVDASGNVIERTTDRTTGPTVVERRGGGGLGILSIVVLLAVVVGAYFLIDYNRNETRKDDAIASAAKEVGDGAKKIGDSAEKAVDSLTK